jgi:hypothetical protein
VGRTIAASPDIGFVWEPFSLLNRPGVLDIRWPYWFPYVCVENEQPYVVPVRDLAAFRYRLGAEIKAVRGPKDAGRMARDMWNFSRWRRREARPLWKDPIAVFSAEWLADRFDAQVIVLIRHPAAVVSSVKRLGWRHPFDHFLRQPLLLRDRLAPFRDEIEEFASAPREIVDEAAMLWKLVHHAIAKYRDERADWLFPRHEDIARRPYAGFRQIYEMLDLTFDQRVERLIAEQTNPFNPPEGARSGDLLINSEASIWNWRTRLTAEEIDRIRARVEPVSKEFYGDADWEGPGGGGGP